MAFTTQSSSSNVATSGGVKKSSTSRYCDTGFLSEEGAECQYTELALLAEFVIRSFAPPKDDESVNQNGRLPTPPDTPPLDGSEISCEEGEEYFQTQLSNQENKGKKKSNRNSNANPRLARFIFHVLRRLHLPSFLVLYSIFLLRRLHEIYPHLRGSPTTPHRLFLSSLILSTKFHTDRTYSNKVWSMVSKDAGMNWSIPEITEMEWQLFDLLGRGVAVIGSEGREEFEVFEEDAWMAWEKEKRRRRIKVPKPSQVEGVKVDTPLEAVNLIILKEEKMRGRRHSRRKYYSPPPSPRQGNSSIDPKELKSILRVVNPDAEEEEEEKEVFSPGI